MFVKGNYKEKNIVNLYNQNSNNFLKTEHYYLFHAMSVDNYILGKCGRGQFLFGF